MEAGSQAVLYDAIKDFRRRDVEYLVRRIGDGVDHASDKRWGLGFDRFTGSLFSFLLSIFVAEVLKQDDDQTGSHEHDADVV
jgi:hypothetical protein